MMFQHFFQTLSILKGYFGSFFVSNLIYDIVNTTINMIQSYTVEKMNDLKLNLYSIQEIKVDSPEHQIFKILQKSTFQLFPIILAVKQSQNNLQKIQLLSLEDLKPIQIKNFMGDSVKLKICFNTLKGLWYLHQIQYFTGSKQLQQFLFCYGNTFNIKINPYNAQPIQGYKFEQFKKDKNIARNGIQLCFDLIKNPKALDVWKWASFTAKTMFNFSIQNYIDKVFAMEKMKEYSPEIVKKNQFLGADELLQVLSQCLMVDPKSRPSIQQIMPVFHKIIMNIQLNENARMLVKMKQQYLEQEKQIKPLMQLQIKDDILLTDDLKKKVCNQFIKNAMKPPKQFKPLFKATRFEFSTRVFYEMCSKNSKLLFVIDALDSGIICSYIEPEISLDDRAGLQGNFISDPSVKSFIYSVKNQETYKLIFKDKAFKCVPGKGPIIGDGDLILGNSPANNQCNFPRSYQSGKSKKLTAKGQFSIKNYDVYTLTF